MTNLTGKPDRLPRPLHNDALAVPNNLTPTGGATGGSRTGQLMRQQLSVAEKEVHRLEGLLANAHREKEQAYSTLSYQLGYALIHVKSLGGLLALPARLLAIKKEAANRKSRKRHIPDGRTVAASQLAPSASARTDATLPVADSDSQRVSVARSILGPVRSPWPLLIEGWPDGLAANAIRCLSITDEFTAACLGHHFGLIEPRPDNWRLLLEEQRPQLLFVESAWRGNAGSWQYRIAKYANPPGQELVELVTACRARGIPTVFWNKEDPVHFERFADTARLFDLVLTTAQERVVQYKGLAVPHVAVLPFAAEKTFHHPIGSRQRNGRVCFAGSYYGDQFPDRQADQEMLLSAATAYPLDIFDRNYSATGPLDTALVFPEKYSQYVRGRLPYAAVNRAHREYSVFLNVNSVTDSPTMFSRRVFELLASGTPVVSTYARGIEEFFGEDLVWMVTSQAEAREAIGTLLQDSAEWRRRSLAGIRKVHGEHLYDQRFTFLLNQLGLAVTKKPDTLLLVGRFSSSAQYQALCANLAHQSLGSVNMIGVLIGPPTVASGVADGWIVLDDEHDWRAQVRELAMDNGATHLAALSPACAYGRFYAQDMLYASRYSGAEIVGKASDLEDVYAFSTAAHPDALLVNFQKLDAAGVDAWSVALDGQLAQAVAAGARIYCADGANFLPELGGQTLPEVWAMVEV